VDQIVVVDYGAGNLRSVARALARVDSAPAVSADPADIDRARAVILPGVGAAADTMANLRERSLVEPLLRYTHMGWNTVDWTRDHPVLDGIASGSYFYFVHSFYPEPADPGVVLGRTEYGRTFASVVAAGNVVATQFHPEKSGDTGLRLYANFLRWARDGAALTSASGNRSAR
jgi:glutamine amidotransferase